jgi:hypothetical protein
MKEETTMFRKTLSVLALTAALGAFGSQAFAAGGGGTGDVVIISGAKQDDSFSVAGGGTGGSTGDVIVIPNFHEEDEYTVNAGGTSKGGDVPVTPG